MLVSFLGRVVLSLTGRVIYTTSQFRAILMTGSCGVRTVVLTCEAG